MNLTQLLQEHSAAFVKQAYGLDLPAKDIQIAKTDEKFEGDLTVLVFPLVKITKQKPQDLSRQLGEYLCSQQPNLFTQFNAVAGFCNVSFADACWVDYTLAKLENPAQNLPHNGKTVLVEYSSPNTNKPLHLGHIRNNLLGFSVSNVLKAAGYGVKMVQIINDRGVHICKSMLAWQRFGNGETPQTAEIKGDHLVGKYYVRFETEFQSEYKKWQQTEAAQNLLNAWLSNEKNVLKAQKEIDKDKEKAREKENFNEADFSLEKYFFKEVYKNTYFNEQSELGAACKKMLQDWENQEPNVIALWQQMNGWVYQGFGETYQKLGVNFDKLYYESQTYLKGKELVEQNLAQPETIFYKEEDGSTWIDLTAAKLDKKVVLRGDGTSMYITQDLGTAWQRFQDFDMDAMIYVVGNEQEYHFQVLFEILKRLGFKFSQQCQHLSYGMVNLPTGRMKSREGTVVDADDLISLLIEEVRKESQERSTLSDLSPEAQQAICEKVALAALKFFILKVEPKKTMIFDPSQSIDLQGQTGPYIQNAYVRTRGLGRKAAELQATLANVTIPADYQLHAAEKEVLKVVLQLPQAIQTAAQTYNPAEVANYLYNLARTFHRFYNDVKIVDKEQLAQTKFRLNLAQVVADTLQYAGALLGMEMPEMM